MPRLGLDFEPETPHDQNTDLLRPFLAVMDKHGPYQFQFTFAADGAPLLCAIPTAEAPMQVGSAMRCHHAAHNDPFIRFFLQVPHDKVNLNYACVRSTKNVRGVFKVGAKRLTHI